MEESKKTKEIIKLISKMRSEIQIEEYIRENIPNELLEDEEFIEKLVDANPLVREALKNLNMDIEKEKVIKAIRRVGLKEVLEDDEKLKFIPKEFKNQLYELAKEYEDEEEFEKAKKIYGRIIELGPGQIGRFNTRFKRDEENRETVYYKSKYSYYRCKVQNGEELTAEDKEELSKLAKEDKENILKLRTPGKMTEYDLFESLFEDIPEEKLIGEILPYIPSGNTRIQGEPSDRPGQKDYIEELSPVNRLKFIKEKWEVISYKLGRGKFAGYVIFSIKDSDVVIVEKFFEEKGRKGNKQLVPSNRAATYIVHKDAEIDLENSGISQLVEKKKEQKDEELSLIDKACHRGITYYDRLIEKFKKIEDNGKKRKVLNADLGQKQVIVEEERKDIPAGQERPEELKQDNDTDSNNKEIRDEQKEDDSIDVENLAQYTLEDLIVVAKQLDSEYTTLKAKINELVQRIQSIQNDIAVITGNLKNGIHEDLTRQEAMQAMEKGLEILAQGKEALAEAKQLKAETVNEATKNREIRNKITNEFDERLRGEE